MAAGYSKRPLIEKLGIREGFKIAVLGAPDNYATTLGKLPKNVTVQGKHQGPLDLIHFFSKESRALQDEFSRLKQALAPSGMLWVSWPKGASGVKTDLNENLVREIGLQHGLVDVKVCAVDETWSGLKFVYRAKDRK